MGYLILLEDDYCYFNLVNFFYLFFLFVVLYISSAFPFHSLWLLFCFLRFGSYLGKLLFSCSWFDFVLIWWLFVKFYSFSFLLYFFFFEIRIWGFLRVWSLWLFSYLLWRSSAFFPTTYQFFSLPFGSSYFTKWSLNGENMPSLILVVLIQVNQCSNLAIRA